MRQMTEQHMINAFGGESMAHMRYLHFAVQADTEGFANTARLFRAIADAERVHAVDHYRVLEHLKGGFAANSMGAFGPGDTLKNLDLAIDGETFEVNEMYPAYMEVARFQKEDDAYRSFEWSYKTERMHKQLFEKARGAVNEKQDVQLGPVQVCQVCGYTLEGEAPETCPVCGAEKVRFKTFD